MANLRSLNVNFRSREETLSSSSSLELEELLSALLVVVDEITGATGWSLLVSFVDLISDHMHNKTTDKKIDTASMIWKVRSILSGAEQTCHTKLL